MTRPRFSTALLRLRNAAPSALCDLIGFAGAGSFAYGAWLIYQPAGFLVAGLLAMLFALLVGRRFTKDAASS